MSLLGSFAFVVLEEPQSLDHVGIAGQTFDRSGIWMFERLVFALDGISDSADMSNDGILKVGVCVIIAGPCDKLT